MLDLSLTREQEELHERVLPVANQNPEKSHQ
jgi:hypothetical protein